LGVAPDTVELQSELLLALVYRVYDQMRDGFTTVQFPKEMNRGWDAVAAVGSFVSVLCGHQDYIENAAVTSASLVVGATSDLRAAQEAVLESLELVREGVDAPSRPARRQLLKDLSDRLAVLEMDLSQYVESVTDIGLWIPSLRVEDYHRSLVASVRLVERTRDISDSLARLTSIAGARAQTLAAIDQAIQEHRRRSWTLVAGLLSAIAIPITFILAFFGVNAKEVNGNLSMFDVTRYYGVYMFAFGMVASSGFVLVGFWWFGHPRRKEDSVRRIK
jgi:hypothetical protein